MVTDGEATTPKNESRNRLLPLVFLLNLILLASLLYTTFGRSLTPSGGVSIVLANDLLSPMDDVILTYPGGTFALPRLDPTRSVGTPLPVGSAFEATLSFKDPQGGAYKQTFPIKPVGEFLIVIHVLPVLEESALKTAEGKDEKVLKPSATKVKILTTFQGENYNI